MGSWYCCRRIARWEVVDGAPIDPLGDGDDDDDDDDVDDDDPKWRSKKDI